MRALTDSLSGRLFTVSVDPFLSKFSWHIFETDGPFVADGNEATAKAAQAAAMAALEAEVR
jgi:hypothetical protein